MSGSSSTIQAQSAPRFGMWNALLVLGYVVAFPAAFVLPQWTGWENGLFEDIQTWTLLGGFAAALLAARRYVGPEKAFFWIAAMFWISFFGREVSWGAAFMPSAGMTVWGPSFYSKNLWYRPAVPWVIGSMLAVAVYWFVRRNLWSNVLVRLWRERALPWSALGLFAFGMIMSTNAEGHGFWHLQDYYGYQVVVIEELVENLGYAALFVAQWQVIHHMLTRWSGRSNA